MSGKTSFVMHLRHIEAFSDLPAADIKRLILAIGEYVRDGIEPNFADNAELKMAFKFIRVDIDSAAAKWEETKAKRIEAGRKGAETRWHSKQ